MIPFHKYKAVRTEVDGISFPSKAEAARYSVLKLLERAGEVSQLTLQPEYPLVVEGEKICVYRADFSYYDNSLERLVVEDVKGMETPEFKLKAKLFMALHPELTFCIVKGKKRMLYKTKELV